MLAYKGRATKPIKNVYWEFIGPYSEHLNFIKKLILRVIIIGFFLTYISF